MEDPLSQSSVIQDLSVTTHLTAFEMSLLLVIMLLLLMMSAFISASEVAFFGLTKAQVNDLSDSEAKTGKLVAKLMDQPRELLTTILIFNNTINIALVILSTIFVDEIASYGGSALLYTILQVIVVTAVILLFGEIMPKIYATKRGTQTALFMARPIAVLSKTFVLLSKALIAISSLFDKVFKEEKKNISVDELSRVHEMVQDKESTEQEKKMLDGILEFGNTDVRRVMRPRTDVIAFSTSTKFSEIKESVVASGYSRIPVFEESFDKVKGILYIKDLLPHITQGDNFNWQDLIRQPFFVPENKKLDDLLIEFQERKIHLAVVIDEYGGTSGVVTMEDVIEEIVGDIRNEFDDDELEYSKIGANKFVLDGKIQLKDLYRILKVDGEDFESNKGDSDTVAGFILELKGDFPYQGERIVFKNYQFIIEAVDRRRIKRVKLEIR